MENLFNLSGFGGYVELFGKGVITVEQFVSTSDRHFFQFFCLNGQNKEHDLTQPEVGLCEILIPKRLHNT